MPDYAIQLSPENDDDMQDVIYRYDAADTNAALIGLPNNVPMTIRELGPVSASFTCSDGSPAPTFSVADYGVFSDGAGSDTKNQEVDLSGLASGDLVFVVSGPGQVAGSMAVTGAIMIRPIERSSGSSGARISIGVFRMIEAGSATAYATVNYVDDVDLVTPKNSNNSLIAIASAKNAAVIDVQITTTDIDGQTMDNVVTPTNVRNEILTWVMGGEDAFGVGRAFTGVTEVREAVNILRGSSEAFGTATDVPAAPLTIISTPPVGTTARAAMISLVLEAAE